MIRKQNALRFAALACALAAILAGILVVLNGWKSGEQPILAQSPPRERAPADENSEPEALLESDRSVVPGATSAGATATPEPPPETPGAPAEKLRVRGSALDSKGRAVAGVGIGKAAGPGAKSAPAMLALTSFDGHFEFDLELDRMGVTLASTDPQFATVRTCTVTLQSAAMEQLLVLAPVLDLAGEVVDESGQALPGVQVEVRVPLGAFAGFPRALDGTRVGKWTTESDAGGHFELLSAPLLEGAELSTSKQGYRSSGHTMPPRSRDDLRLVLARLSEGGRKLVGVVLHIDGLPATGARVQFGRESTDTLADGSFELPLKDVREDASLVAAKRGWQPALVEEFGRTLTASKEDPPPVRLVLGPPSLVLSGVVVDAQKLPLAGWNVSLLDPTEITWHSIPALTAEDLSAGSSRARHITGADGAFRFDGLCARNYRLQAYERTDLLRGEFGPFAAGAEGVELVIPADSIWPQLTGRVRSSSGLSLSNVTVSVTLTLQRTRTGVSWVTGRSAATDGAGRFTLERIPKSGIELSIDGESVMPQRFALHETDDPQSIELEATMRCRFRVELGEALASQANGFQLLDQAGEAVLLATFEANQWSSSQSGQLADGKSHVLSIGEGRYTLVLQRLSDGVELGRHPIELVPGEISVIRL
jgi:hypothetical protein